MTGAHSDTRPGTDAGTAADLDWLLDELVDRIPAVRSAIVLSTDGLPVAASASLSRESGEHLAAVASGLHGLAKGASRHFDTGSVRQTMIEFDRGFLFVMAAGGGAGLAVFTAGDADVGLVAYEMTRLVRQVGEHLSAPARSSAAAP
jgi:predicted regulator of Ras-like GTPase activity (Roadblock/LC7/MglB family)